MRGRAPPPQVASSGLSVPPAATRAAVWSLVASPLLCRRPAVDAQLRVELSAEEKAALLDRRRRPSVAPPPGASPQRRPPPQPPAERAERRQLESSLVRLERGLRRARARLAVRTPSPPPHSSGGLQPPPPWPGALRQPCQSPAGRPPLRRGTKERPGSPRRMASLSALPPPPQLSKHRAAAGEAGSAVCADRPNRLPPVSTATAADPGSGSSSGPGSGSGSVGRTPRWSGGDSWRLSITGRPASQRQCGRHRAQTMEEVLSSCSLASSSATSAAVTAFSAPDLKPLPSSVPTASPSLSSLAPSEGPPGSIAPGRVLASASAADRRTRVLTAALARAAAADGTPKPEPDEMRRRIAALPPGCRRRKHARLPRCLQRPMSTEEAGGAENRGSATRRVSSAVMTSPRQVSSAVMTSPRQVSSAVMTSPRETYSIGPIGAESAMSCSGVGQSSTAECGMMPVRAPGGLSEPAIAAVAAPQTAAGGAHPEAAAAARLCEERGTLTAAGDVPCDLAVQSDALSFTERLLLRQLRGRSASWSRQLQRLRDDTQRRRSRLERTETQPEQELGPGRID